MSEQALDLKGSVQIVRRHWPAVTVVAALGLAAGLGFAALNRPQVSSTALVQFSSRTQTAQTEAVIARSSTVLARAIPAVQPRPSISQMAAAVQVRTTAPGILSVIAQARTAPQAVQIANAVAASYVAYVTPSTSPVGQVNAFVLEKATSAAGRSLPVTLAIDGVIGLLIGMLVGAIAALALNRRDPRLRRRDSIADALGVAVLASVEADRPADAAGWVKLLTEYDPGPVDAWRLRGALQQLGLADASAASAGPAAGVSLAVLSLNGDPCALAIGPQLAVFAAALGIRTRLVIGPQQDPSSTASLRAACTGMAAVKSRWSRYLQVAVRDPGSPRDRPSAALTIVVNVVDEKAPHVADKMRTTSTIVAVSAGLATAEDLARLAVSTADDGRQISGIIVANPESSDQTTGRLPQPARPASRRPSHLTGIPTETRRWMTQTTR